MYRQRKLPTDPCNARFMESYDSGMREQIGDWRDEGYGFERISRLLMPDFSVGAYIIEETTKDYDTRFFEETGIMKDMIFLKQRTGISDGEIKRRLNEEGIGVEMSSIGHAFSKWESDKLLGNEQMMRDIKEHYMKGMYAHDIVEHYRGNGIDLKESAVKSALSRSGAWRKKKSKYRLHEADNSIDFPGNNTGGSMPARSVRNRSGY